MTEAQAGALLLRSGSQGLCVRFQHDSVDIRFEPARARTPTRSTRPATNVFASVAIGVAACSPASTIHPSSPVEPRSAAPATSVTTEPSHDPVPAAVVADAGATTPKSCTPAEHAQNARRVIVVEATQGLVILNMVQFARGDHAIDARGREILAHVAEALRNNPQITKIAIIGHASTDERDALELSRLRARQVLEALVSLKIEPARLVIEAHGYEEPIANNASSQGRAKNRRIEFKILSETR